MQNGFTGAAMLTARLFFLSLLLPYTPLTADERLTGQLEDTVAAYRQVFDFAGTVRVVQGDELVLQQSVGPAERAFNVPHRADTRVSINSISKTFTAVAALRLAARGLLELDKPVGHYLPNLKTDWADNVTAHHLLSHVSGLPREAGLDSHSTQTLASQLESVAGLTLNFEPGSRYGYSNAGYIVLGNVIEAASTRSFTEVIESEVIQPLKLKDTGLYVGRRVVERQAVPYRLGPDGVVEAQRSKTLGASAGGGMYSTPADLERFVLGLENDSLLDGPWREKLFAPHAAVTDSGHEAYAWSIKQFGPLSLRFSAGSGYGTKSVVVRDPQSGLFIAIVSNWGNFPILDLLRDLFLITQGQEIARPDGRDLPRPDALASVLGRYQFDADALRTALQAEDDELVVQVFEGRVFLDDELLAVKSEGVYGLTYTDELTLRFENQQLILTIDDRELRGRRMD
jgi:CubicO group peptidase (beta-lactamase class C family)